MSIRVTEAIDLGGDVLLVRGELEADGETVPLEAKGWVSALENHYPPDAYDRDGALKLKDTADGAPGDPEHEPRKMSKAERLEHCRGLLEAAAAATATPKSLGISG